MIDRHIKWGLKWPNGSYNIFSTRESARYERSWQPEPKPKVVKLLVSEVK